MWTGAVSRLAKALAVVGGSSRSPGRAPTPRPRSGGSRTPPAGSRTATPQTHPEHKQFI